MIRDEVGTKLPGEKSKNLSRTGRLGTLSGARVDLGLGRLFGHAGGYALTLLSLVAGSWNLSCVYFSFIKWKEISR
jgi:uncharacterized membrane protein (Fun14 family)